MIPLTQEQAQQLEEGDKLVCIHMEEGYNDKLEIGKDYTVDSFEYDWVWVKIKETGKFYEYYCFTLPDSNNKENLMNMRDEVIDLWGSTIEQRRELGTLLTDLGEVLFNLQTLLDGDYSAYFFSEEDWSGGNSMTPTMGIQSFINKYIPYSVDSEPQTISEDVSVATILTTKVVIGDSREKFEIEVNTLEKEGYNILPETFLINDKRYTILMQLNKPRETPCLQL